ncbi:MAG TPA: hypothetical protein VIH57_19630 [Bacteroidales bacterium]
MKKYLLLFILLTLVLKGHAQKRNNREASLSLVNKVTHISLKAENWEFKPQTVDFFEYKSRPVMKLLNSSDPVILKDFNFIDGTIEYDMEPLDPRFTSCYFRWKDSKESECFYFRTGRAGNSQAIDAIQYAPIINGVNLWDMLFHYQTNADFKKDDWNHVKLVISGKQMRAYVNDTLRPALEVPMLEGNVTTGTLAFDGKVIISNLKVKHNSVEGLAPEAGIDPTSVDPRYLRKWQVSSPVTTAKGIDFSDDYVANADTKWEDITAERRGLINLTRKFGKTEGRRIVWLKTIIHSDKAQDKILRFGFSDEVWVVINDRPLYIDKNLYNTPMAKQPDGRCSIENTSFKVPLKEGDNQLLVGVSNFFYGWGIVARLDNLDGIKIEK